MRIPGSNLPEVDTSQLREKPGTEQAKQPQEIDAPRIEEAAVASASIDRTVVDVEAATRELHESISARLEQVREQLRSGTYAVDYDRLARRMADEGFGS